MNILLLYLCQIHIWKPCFELLLISTLCMHCLHCLCCLLSSIQVYNFSTLKFSIVVNKKKNLGKVLISLIFQNKHNEYSSGAFNCVEFITSSVILNYFLFVTLFLSRCICFVYFPWLYFFPYDRLHYHIFTVIFITRHVIAVDAIIFCSRTCFVISINFFDFLLY